MDFEETVPVDDEEPEPVNVRNNPQLLNLSIAFCVLVFILNSFSVLVTFMLSSVWHAILDNFRPISISLSPLPASLTYPRSQELFSSESPLGIFLRLERASKQF